MSKVITFSRIYPAYHPQAGKPTFFVEKIHNWWWDNANTGHASMSDLLFELNPGKSRNLIQKFIDSLDQDGGYGLGEKGHTIRAGHRWKPGDKFSPRVWSGRPYNSPQITIAPDIEVVKTWDFEIKTTPGYGMRLWINNQIIDSETENELAANDGLSKKELLEWFKFPKPFYGQIICYDTSINY